MNGPSKVDLLAVEPARLLDVPSLDQNRTVAELGWDSMMLVELAIAAEVVYDKRISLDKLHIDFNMKLVDILRSVDGPMRETVPE